MGKTYAIFTALYPPHLGGIEVFSQGLAQALVERGNHVTVVTNDSEGIGCGRMDESGIEVVRLPCIPLVSGRLPLPVLNRRNASIWRELERRRYDGVLVNARFYPHCVSGMRFARKHGLRPIVLDHGSDYLSFGSPALDVIVRLYEKAITEFGRRYRASYYGVSRKSVDWLRRLGIHAEGVIPNAIDAEKYRDQSSGRDFLAEQGLDQGKFVVAFVGRLIPEKGVRSIIDASRCEDLRRRGVIFLLAGDGPLAKEVERAQSASLRWLGRLDTPDVAALLLRANALCLPSKAEGFCIALIEAAACGCAVVSSDVGVAGDLIPSSDYGVILEDCSSESVARALIPLADDRCLTSELASRCRSLVERQYSWDAVARSVERAFASANETGALQEP